MKSNELLQLLMKGARGELTAIRCVTKLQPADGPGGKIFPPTYEGGAYAFEDRVIGGARVKTVLLDSVQSSANRLEEALLGAIRAGRLQMPVFELKVGEHEVTSLTTPHRVHDAILRDSIWNGQPFRESDNGKRLISARAWNATAFFEYAPHVLLLGTWDSQGGGGVNSAKIARCLVSEVIAIDAELGMRTSSRIDPLGIKKVDGVIAKTDDASQWRFLAAPDKKAKLLKPSEINHGNVTPSIKPGGVTFREAVHTTVLSLTQLRKLRFPDGDATSEDRNAAGRAVIAALGLFAVTLQQEDGYQLRSRCHLVPEEVPEFEAIGRTGKDTEKFGLTSADAEAALNEALGAAEKLGLKWHRGSIVLTPREDLLKLVAYSDKAVAASQGE